MIPRPPQQKQPTGSKVADYVYRFRVLATRHSFKLIYLWAGMMLVGLGLLHYRKKTGGKVQYTSEDMQPDPEVSRKIVNWIEKLGLDKTVDKPRR